MLTIHESLKRFRALLSVNNYKIYDLLLFLTPISYQKFLFNTFIFLLREELSVLGYLFFHVRQNNRDKA